MKKLKHAVLICSLVGSALAGNATASASNLLTNGSFETGDLSGWDFTGNTTFTNVLSYPVYAGAQEGLSYVYAGPIGSYGMLSQTFSDIPGQTILISGWVAGNGTLPSDVNFLFNGVTQIAINPVPNQPWTQYTFSAQATGTDTFAVSFRNDPDFVSLDNFSATPTPEPGTYALMGIGGLIVAFGLRKSGLALPFSA